MPVDLWQLHECYGQSRSFRSIAIQALAAQARTARWEAFAHGGLHYRTRAKILRHDLATAEYMGRARVWHDWYRRSHVLLLDGVSARLRKLGIDADQVMSELAADRPKPWSSETTAHARKSYQKAMGQKILEAQRPNVEARIRDKMERWKLPDLPRHVAERTRRKLELL